MEVYSVAPKENNKFIVTGEKSAGNAEGSGKKRSSGCKCLRFVYTHHSNKVLTKRAQV
jgi:hypothetical protein